MLHVCSCHQYNSVGTAIFVLVLREERRLRVFENRVLRRCIRPRPGRERIIDVVPREWTGFEPFGVRRGGGQAAHTGR
jgi:hypothetical protein